MLRRDCSIICRGEIALSYAQERLLLVDYSNQKEGKPSCIVILKIDTRKFFYKKVFVGTFSYAEHKTVISEFLVLVKSWVFSKNKQT